MAKKSKKKKTTSSKPGGNFGKSSVGGFTSGMDKKMAKVKF